MAPGRIPVDVPPPETGSITSVSASVSAVDLLAAGARRGAVIANDGAALMYVALGEDASTSNWSYRLDPYDSLETAFAGRISAAWSTATGAARVTELT